MFVLTVIELHRRLRGVAAIAMKVHEQFAIIHWQFGMFVEGQEILVDLVACRTDNLDGALPLDAFLHGAHRRYGG